MIRSGAYALFLRFDCDVNVNVGALGTIALNKGEYCYIGSARNGLDQRIGRHLSKEKKIHWHIDNLTIIAHGIEAFETTDIEECVLRKTAEDSGMSPIVKGFGCSDCMCDTHLLSLNEMSKRVFLGSTKLVPFKAQ